ncbi:inosine/xanthosine triphosphatase [Vulcanisaeta thermophila]|uniref:inosine/xanthosine triphosphatase n=1 Tax=Vulcanisaeta thermophila TaxID=867917 RepID=UPI000853206F|nr:inosine/xanthosine triphosphatase [Vulcanisaeta thermophila]
MTLRIAVGSRNPNKVRGVKRALSLLGLRALVIPVEPPEDTPREPLGINEIAKGALRRAQHAINAVPDSVFGIGIEAGVLTIESMNTHLDVTMAVVLDQYGIITVGLSPGFMIPSKFMEEIRRGVELNEVVERYYGVRDVGRRWGFVSMVSRGFVDREWLNAEAVYMALLPRMPWNARLYNLRDKN